MVFSDELDRILDEARDVAARARRQREIAQDWAGTTLAVALERLRPFLEDKLKEVAIDADGLVVAGAKLAFAISPGPPLGTAGVVPSLEVVASVVSEVPGLATERLTFAPLEDASAVWVQHQVLVFLRRIAPHLVERAS